MEFQNMIYTFTKHNLKFVLMDLIYSILIGLVAGFLGSKIFKGSGSGLLWNIIIGIVGGALGGWLSRHWWRRTFVAVNCCDRRRCSTALDYFLD